MSGMRDSFGKANGFQMKGFHHNQPSHKYPNSNGSQSHHSERDNRNHFHLQGKGNFKRSFEDLEISQMDPSKRRKIDIVETTNSKHGLGTLLQSSFSKPSSTLNGTTAIVHNKPNLAHPSPKNYPSPVGLFDPAIVTRYLSWNEVKRVGPGFYNEGNSCYLNSTLQCLLYIPALVQVLLQENGAAFKNIPRNLHNQMKPISEIFAMLVSEVWGETGALKKPILPRGMVTTIRRVGKQFKPFRQEDAHEYLRQLLDTMHEEVLKANRLKTSDGKPAETTFISRIFGGYLCNTLTCSQCNYASKTYNHFLDLSLEIRQGIQSLQDAIAHFIKPEYLSHGNEWSCDGCKRKVKAKKQMTISEAPPVLAIQLKRFAMSFGLSFMSNNKITKNIQFPAHLSLPCTKSKQPVEYDLTGVVVHHGSTTHSGHYIAYVKAPNGSWYEMNDSCVSQVPINRVLQAQAYLLFYSQKGKAPVASAPVPSPSAMIPAPDRTGSVTEPLTAAKKEDTTKIGGSVRFDVSIPDNTTQTVQLPSTPRPKLVANAAMDSDDDEEDSEDEDSSTNAGELESDIEDDIGDEESVEDDEDFPPLYCTHIFKYKSPLQRFRRWYWSTRPNLYKERHLLRKFEYYHSSRNTKMILRKYLLVRQHIAGKFASESENDDDDDDDDLESALESDSDFDRDLFIKSNKKVASSTKPKKAFEPLEDSRGSEEDDATSSSSESDKSVNERTEQDDDRAPRVKSVAMNGSSKQQRREDQFPPKQHRSSDRDQSLDIRNIKESKVPLQANAGAKNPSLHSTTEQKHHAVPKQYKPQHDKHGSHDFKKQGHRNINSNQLY